MAGEKGGHERAGTAQPLAGAAEDDSFKKLYRGLWASEHGHYLTFVRLAERVQKPETVARRWKELLAEEARIICRQEARPRMHSGVR